jgi:surface polysaccharide O-acyltransferase-like enzyme
MPDDRPQTDRNRLLDRWRGLAVILMVLDHLLAAALANQLTESPAAFLTRVTLTRLAMPVFMVVSGYLAYRHAPSRRRLIEVAAAALVVNLLWAVLPMGAAPPDILVIWLAAIALRRFWVQYPVPTVVLGLVQSVALPFDWGGYQPGLVVALLAVGVLAAMADAIPMVRLPDVVDRPVCAIGRHPLGWYLVHIAVIAAITVVLVRTGNIAYP